MSKLNDDFLTQKILSVAGVSSVDKLTVSDVRRYLEKSLKPGVLPESFDEYENELINREAEMMLKKISGNFFPENDTKEFLQKFSFNDPKFIDFHNKFDTADTKVDIERKKKFHDMAVKEVLKNNPSECKNLQELYPEYEITCQNSSI